MKKVIRYVLLAVMVLSLPALSACKKSPAPSADQATAGAIEETNTTETIEETNTAEADTEPAAEKKKEATAEVTATPAEEVTEEPTAEPTAEAVADDDKDAGTAETGDEDKNSAGTETADTGAQDAAGQDASSVALKDLYNVIAGSVSLPEMYFADAGFMLNYYGIDASKLEDYVFASCLDSTSADSIILIRLKDEASANEVIGGLNMVLEQMGAELENYNPEANELVKAAKVRRNGKNIDLIIHKDRKAILSIIDSAL
ncbi:MAG: DUF4358 domain-containing protein [Lachnospiraceae bacterium]|nr:DUF4358 domain-containing protein [Lachnospiraceae bacterium]